MYKQQQQHVQDPDQTKMYKQDAGHRGPVG